MSNTDQKPNHAEVEILKHVIKEIREILGETGIGATLLLQSRNASSVNLVIPDWTGLQAIESNEKTGIGFVPADLFEDDQGVTKIDRAQDFLLRNKELAAKFSGTAKEMHGRFIKALEQAAADLKEQEESKTAAEGGA